MTDEDVEKVYGDYARFYLTFLSKTKIVFSGKVMDDIFHSIMSKNGDYNEAQVDRVINNNEP